MGHPTPPGEAVAGMVGLDDELGGGHVDLAHVVPVNYLGRLSRVDGDKVLGGARPGVDDDGINLPRM